MSRVEIGLWQLEVRAKKCVEALRKNGFDGLLLPDHGPALACEAPWHASRAFTMGWLKAAIGASPPPRRIRPAAPHAYGRNQPAET